MLAPRSEPGPDPSGRPTVVHVMHRFDTGGLENGVVNLINHLPPERFAHVVLALTEVTEFRHRVQREDVQFIALHKPPGHALKLYPRLYRLFRRIRPAIVHTRNLGALEVSVPAWAAGVPVRIHGEHGRDANDPDGERRRYQRLRRAYAPFVSRWVALSQDLGDYLTQRVGIAPQRVSQVYNGVDITRFNPRGAVPEAIEGCPFDPRQHWIAGTVGRMAEIKDQTNLARAFIAALQREPALAATLRLAMVGDGPLKARVEALLREAGVAHLAWLPGERRDVPQIMRGLHAFVLPSLGEGISNTILEAMASGLPVLATRVGGNAELVAEGETGRLVPPGDPAALAAALSAMAQAPEASAAQGLAGRRRVEQRFSLQAMVAAYQALYDGQIAAAALH